LMPSAVKGESAGHPLQLLRERRSAACSKGLGIGCS